MRTLDINSFKPEELLDHDPVNIVHDIFQSAGYTSAEAKRDTSYGFPVMIDDFEGKVQLTTNVLGRDLTAWIAEADATSDLERWIEGTTRPQLEVARRMCITEVIIKRFHRWFPDAISLDQHSPDIEAWLLGQNEQFGNTAPAAAIREQRFIKVAPKIATALFELKI